MAEKMKIHTHTSKLCTVITVKGDGDKEGEESNTQNMEGGLRFYILSSFELTSALRHFLTSQCMEEERG